MKICYLADAGSVHTQRWVEYFAGRGYDVHLLSGQTVNNAISHGTQYHPLNFSKSAIRIPGKVLIANVVKVKKVIHQFNPDIVHAHSVLGYGVLGALSSFHPFVISAWGSDVLVAPQQSLMNKLTIRFALDRADIVLTTSHYLKGYLVHEYNLPNSKVKAMPWGVDLKIFNKGHQAEVQKLKQSLGIKNATFLILSPRHLSEQYSIEDIVRAVPYIVSKYPNVYLVLLKGAAEDGLYERRIDELIDELGIGKNVKIIRRHLSAQEMAVMYNACDAFVSIHKGDQFASTIQEGMACGSIPIVGNQEVYKQYLAHGKNALFFEPNEPRDIAEKVIFCIENPQLKQRFYKINRKIIEEHEDWGGNMAKVEKLYRNLIRRR